jgi:MtfA peptidase
MVVWDRVAHAWAIAGAAAFLGFAAVGIVAGAPELAAGGAALAVLWYVVLTRRSRLRRRLAVQPIPERWRAILTDQVSFFRDLPPERRADFERDVALFIGETRFTGIDGVEVTEELKVLTAASAVMLLFNRPDLEYRRVSEVLLYPRAFSRDFKTHGPGRDLTGLHDHYGAVVLSAPELRRSFEPRHGAAHVGLHEFAHALDWSGQGWEGLPRGMDARLAEVWSKAYKEELEKLKQGRSVLDPYAETDAVEFFAVSVETYFQTPEDLRQGAPEIYEVLEKYFRASPKGEEPPPRAKRRPDGK